MSHNELHDMITTLTEHGYIVIKKTKGIIDDLADCEAKAMLGKEKDCASCNGNCCLMNY